MPLVKAECPSCGGTVEVDSNKDASICPYCGSAYIVEDAIQNYITANSVIFANNVELNNDKSKELIEAGLKQLEINACREAQATYKELTQYYPSYYQGWLGLAVAESNNFKTIDKTIDMSLIDKAVKTAPAEKVDTIKSLKSILVEKRAVVKALREKQIEINHKINGTSNEIKEYFPNPESKKNSKNILEWAVIIVIACIAGFIILRLSSLATRTLVGLLAVALILWIISDISEKNRKCVKCTKAEEKLKVLENEKEDIETQINEILDYGNCEIDVFNLLEY